MGKVLGTVRLHSCRPMESIRKKLLEGGVQARTPYMLFHAIASHFMDEYFPLLDTLNQQIEEIEDRIFQKPREGQKKPIKSSNGETLAKFLSTKKRISRLRRTLTPQRDVFGRLARDEFPFISKQAMVYFRDIYDQLMRTTEIIDGFRDMLSSMLEAHLSLASNRLNEVMKLFTVVTVIFLPLMFITGVYGMNFKFMPELEKPWGYPTTLGAMALLIVGLIWYFKRRRWL
jgi:magnesium transporter